MSKVVQYCLFNRFLKEHGLYFYYYDYIRLSHFSLSDYMVDCPSLRNILMDSFSWSSCNKHYHRNIEWSVYHGLWYKLCQIKKII